MAADDILWKNVEAMKAAPGGHPPPATKDSPMPSESARKPSQAQDTVSPSRATNSARSMVNLDASSSTQGNGMSAIPNVTDQSAESNNANQTNGRTHDCTSVSDVRLLSQVPARPAQRRPERYAFQFWADQIT